MVADCIEAGRVTNTREIPPVCAAIVDGVGAPECPHNQPSLTINCAGTQPYGRRCLDPQVRPQGTVRCDAPRPDESIVSRADQRRGASIVDEALHPGLV